MWYQSLGLGLQEDGETARDSGGIWGGKRRAYIFISLEYFFFFVIVVNVDLKCEFHQIHPSSLLTSGSQGPNSSENLLSGSYFTSRVPPLDFVIDQLS